MQYIGSVGNTQFAFSNGLLAGFRVPTHRKRLQELREQFAASHELHIEALQELSASSTIQQTYRPNEALTSRTYWQTIQDIGIGHRALDLEIDTIPVEKDQSAEQPSNMLRSTLSISFELTAPLTWEGRLPSVSVEPVTDPYHIVLRTTNNVTVEMIATQPFRVRSQPNETEDEVIINAALPNGESQIHVTVTSLPYFPILDTVVLCRPQQFREAAVILSCLPSTRFSPLIVSEAPPITVQEYMAIYTLFQEAHDKSMVNVMGLGRVETREMGADQDRKSRQQILEHWRYQEELTPYRSWVQRNRQLSDLLSQVRIKTVVLLFDAQDSDFETIYPDFHSKMPEQIKAKVSGFFPSDCDIVCLLENSAPSPQLSNTRVREYRYSNLSQLADLAWEKLQATPIPNRSVEIAENNESAYPLGLYDALSEHVPLRPIPGIIHKDETDRVRLPDVGEAHEAVVVELTGEAQDFVGVLYARFRGAKLVLRPSPQLTAVERALSGFNEAQLQAAGVHRSGRGLLDSIRRFISGDWAAVGLAGIEAAVTEQIPEYVAEHVGDRILTAFTRGLPYGFLKRGQYNWSEKPIGHVVNDPDLVVLRELFLSGTPRTVFSLSAIFDPGYFRTSETEDVLRALDAHLTHPLVLEKEMASFLALQSLSAVKGLEFLFFNTHGSDDAIVLDIPLRNSLLLQWISFKGNPIVFNNSCLSWIGVGREFMRIGARGYIGTLWSVDSRDAATIARHVMKRLTGHRMSVPETLCKISVRPLTRRAYIFVGTCSVFLDDWAEVSERHNREYATNGVQVFSELLRSSLRGDDTRARPLRKFLYHQLVDFAERVERLASDDYVGLFAARSMELRALANESTELEVSPEYENKVIELCRKYLAKMDLSEEQRREHEQELTKLEVDIKHRHGRVLEAIDIIDVERDEKLDESQDTSNVTTLIEMLKQTGQYEKAIEIGIKMRAQFEKVGDKNGVVTVVGQLCQLYKRIGDAEKGLDLARTGFTLAAEIGQSHRQPDFKLDESHLLKMQGRYDEAIEAARVASRLFRIQHNENGDLRCYGVIGQCFLSKGNRDDARTWFTAGYKFAKELKDITEVALFAVDLGNLEASAGNVRESAAHFLEALDLFVKTGHYESIPAVVYAMTELCIHHADYKLFGTLLCSQLLMLNQLQPTVAGSIVPVIFEGIKGAIQLEHEKDVQPVLSALGVAMEFGNSLASSNQVQLTAHLAFMLDVIRVIGIWLTGQVDTAVKYARNLDLASGGALRLEELVSATPKKLGPKS